MDTSDDAAAIAALTPAQRMYYDSMRVALSIASSLPPNGVPTTLIQPIVDGLISDDPAVVGGFQAIVGHYERQLSADSGLVSDDNYGYDAGALEAPLPTASAAEQLRAVKAANTRKRLEEAAFEARRAYSADGFRCELLQRAKCCDVDGCVRPQTTLCEDCLQPGFRLCAQHDMEVHARSGRAHRSRFALLSSLMPGLGAFVLKLLTPNQYIRASDAAAAGPFSGCSPGDILHDVPVQLPVQPPSACQSCGDVLYEPVFPSVDAPRASRVRVFGVGGPYDAVYCSSWRCLGAVLSSDGSTKTPCGVVRASEGRPVDTLAASVTPLTTEVLRSAIVTKDLAVVDRADQHTPRGMSAADVASLLGLGAGSDMQAPPLLTLRSFLWRRRRFLLFARTAMMGLYHQCIACGDSPSTLNSDVTLSAGRYKNDGPGSWASTYETAAGFQIPLAAQDVMDASMAGYKAGTTTTNKCASGSSEWEAAAERAVSKRLADKLALHGLALLVCPHICAHSLMFLRGPENMLVHIQAFVLAAFRGARRFGLDVSCQFFQHLRVQSENNPGFADALVRNMPLAAGVGPAAASWQLRFEADNEKAPFVRIVVRRAPVVACVSSSVDESPAPTDGAPDGAPALEGGAPMPVDDSPATGGSLAPKGGASTSADSALAPEALVARLRELVRLVRAAEGINGEFVCDVPAPLARDPAGDIGSATSSIAGGAAQLLSVDSVDRLIQLALPLVHAAGHQCRARFCSTTPRWYSWMREVSEMIHALGGPYVRSSQVKNACEGAHADAHEGNLRAFNLTRIYTIASSLLDLIVARLRKYASAAASVLELNTDGLSDEQLEELAVARAERVLEPRPNSAARTQYVRDTKRRARLTALEGCLAAAAAARAAAAAVEGSTEVDAVRAEAIALVTALRESGDAKLKTDGREPAVLLTEAKRVVGALRAQVAAATAPQDVDALVCAEFRDTLYPLGRYYSSLRAQRSALGPNDLRLPKIVRCERATLVKARASLGRLKAWMLMSETASVRAAAAQLPLPTDIGDPSRFPRFPDNKIGVHTLQHPHTATDQLLTAYCNMRGLGNAVFEYAEDIGRARNNTVHALYSLAERLSAVASVEPNWELASGRSGLLQEPNAACLPVLFALPRGELTQRMAGGVAAAMYEGLVVLVSLYDQLDRLKQAVDVVNLSPGALPSVVVGSNSRAVACVKAKPLLRGTMSPSAWAAASFRAPAGVAAGSEGAGAGGVDGGGVDDDASAGGGGGGGEGVGDDHEGQVEGDDEGEGEGVGDAGDAGEEDEGGAQGGAAWMQGADEDDDGDVYDGDSDEDEDNVGGPGGGDAMAEDAGGES